MKWLFWAPVRRDRVNWAQDFYECCIFNEQASSWIHVVDCRSHGPILLIPMEKSTAMRSASRSPGSPVTVGPPPTLTLQSLTSSRTQTTVSLCWPVRKAVDIWEAAQKACPLQLLHYPQAPKALNRCLLWRSVSRSSPFPGSHQRSPTDRTSGRRDNTLEPQYRVRGWGDLPSRWS